MHLLAFAEVIQLFPDGTIFIHIAMILGMIWILNRTFFRPINRVLEAREKNKGGHSTEAEEILKEAETKSATFHKEMLEARSEGYELVAKEHQKASNARLKKLEKAKAEITSRFESEREDLEKQKAEARAAIGAEAEDLAEKITTNILRVK
jgi:F-type H+-transporting ATPase subunit b